MNRIRAGVIATLLGVWCFPMVSSAKAVASEPAPLAAIVNGAGNGVGNGVGTTGGSGAAPSSGSEAANLSTREQQARTLEDFKGGGVTIYIGSGVLLIVLIILLIILI
jgi:hypothetical protein